jgi:hypothetical protein
VARGVAQLFVGVWDCAPDGGGSGPLFVLVVGVAVAEDRGAWGALALRCVLSSSLVACRCCG